MYLITFFHSFNILRLKWLQVSLYGHSLGSVLSYDILCHQETLTSPFPMEWIYKDNIKYESCTPNDMKSSSHDSQVKSFNEIVAMDSKKLDSVTLDQVGLGVDLDQSEMTSKEEDGPDDSKNMDGEDEDDCQHDENSTVKSLREEVTEYRSFICAILFVFERLMPHNSNARRLVVCCGNYTR